ncbi:MAG: 3',5'-cyclic-nucleotide phosphodiesterase [Gammaproteobacteria bacterium]|nr:3',5'-cyclic-nucleotide phosphodiesterase [Gammaproteobacteria bacterium]
MHDDMRIQALGCSGGIARGLRTTAMLVDEHIVIDAGTGLGDLPLDALRRIEHVFLTHAHLDHIAGLPLFVDSTQGRQGRTPVTVHARTETIAALRRHIFNDVIWPDFSRIEGRYGPLLVYQPIRAGEVVDLEVCRVGAVDVAHTVPALGYWVSDGRHTFGFSGDTRTNDSLWSELNAQASLDALIVEVSFPNEQRRLADVAGHYCPATLGVDLERLHHDPDIWVTAMKPGEEQLILRQLQRALPHRRLAMLQTGQVLSL